MKALRIALALTFSLAIAASLFVSREAFAQCPVITISPASLTNGKISTAYGPVAFSALPAATYTFDASGLPAGMSMSSAGSLAGTPTASGTFAVRTVATDTGGCVATHTIPLFICPAITVTNPAVSSGTNGTPFSQTFTQSGAGSPIFTTASTLPTGLSLSTAGVLSGTPTLSGVFPIVVTVTDSNGCSGTGSTYNLVICNTITVTNPGVSTGTTGVAFSQTFTQSGATGGATFTTASTLPSGFSLSTAGVLSGTTNQTGSFPITVTVTDGNGCTGTSSGYTLVISCATITVARTGGGSFPADTFNVAYPGGNSVVATGGSGTYTYAVTSGALPTSMSLNTSNGAITGTPSATGTFTFTITATDTATSCTGSQSFSIAVNPVAGADTYNNLVNNTQAAVTGGTTTSPATPFVALTGSILANDLPAGGVTVSGGTFATTQAGSVTIAADGTFLYTPPVTAAAIASDTFTYIVASNTGATGTPTTANGTVTLNLANRVWYVKNNGSNGNGQSQSPFNTLANFVNGARVSPDKPSDIIYVFTGDGTTTNQNAGVALLTSEQLIGEGVALIVNTNTLVVAGSKPLITNATALSDGITLNNGNTIKGLTVTGATRHGISGTGFSNFTGDTLTLQTAANAGLELTNFGGAVTLTNTTFTGNGGGGGVGSLDIQGGTATITVNNTNTINSSSGRSVDIQSRTGAAGITIGATINDTGGGIFVGSTSGAATFVFSGSQTLSTTTNPAVTLSTNTAGVVTFSGTLNITTTTGIGFTASGSNTLNVSGTANITTGAAANALSLTGITVGGSGVAFTSINTTGATTGIALASVTGTVAVNGGTLTNGTTGVSLQGATTNLSLSGMTITGPTTGITNTTNFGTLTIGASVNVSGVTALNLATGNLNGTFANLSSTGGVNGVKLTSIGGTGWTATAGILAGATTAAFKVDGGNANMTYGGSITSAAFLVDIGATTGRSGGTITFSTGTLGGTAAQAGTGIRIQNSTGTSTFTFSGTQTLGTSGSRMGSTAVTFAGNNSTTSFNFSGTLSIFTGAVTAFSATGPTGGTITFSGTDSIDSSASALVLNGVNLGAGTLSSVISAGGVNGISLTTVTGGTLTISGGSLSGNTGHAFLVSGGSATMSDAGTITQNTAGQNAVNIQNAAGGTITLSGAIGSTSNGILLNSNTGATINISGNMTLSTATIAAFTATGGGTVNVTGLSNSITTSTGTGINWNGVTGTATETFNTVTATTSGTPMSVTSSGATNFTVGTVSSQTGTAVSITTATGDFVFTKISSNGAAKGIAVSALTGGGSFTVNGTGGLCDSTHIGASDCTGGSILGGTTRGGEFNNATTVTLKNMYFKGNGTTAVGCVDDISSGSDVACNAAIHLTNNSSNVVLDHVYVDGTGSNDMGILGNAVSALSLTNVEVANFTNTAKVPIVLQNLSGICPFTSLNVHNNSGIHSAFVTQNTGTSTITFTSPTFTNNFGASNPDQIQVDAYSSANITVSATNVNISSSSINTGNGVAFQASSGSTMNATLNGGTVTGTNGVLVDSSGNGTQLTYLVNGLTNVANHNLGAGGITVGKGSGGAGSVTTGSVTGNTITSATCGGGCFGITVKSFGAGGSASATVTGNDVSGVDGSAIAATAGQGSTATTTIIQNNNIHNPALTQPGNIANSSYALDLIAGTQAGDAPCFFVNIGDMSVGHTVPANKNTITGAWGGVAEVVEFNNAVFKILNLSGGAGPWVTASNNFTPANTDATQLGTVPFQAGTSCP